MVSFEIVTEHGTRHTGLIQSAGGMLGDCGLALGEALQHQLAQHRIDMAIERVNHGLDPLSIVSRKPGHCILYPAGTEELTHTERMKSALDVPLLGASATVLLAEAEKHTVKAADAKSTLLDSLMDALSTAKRNCQERGIKL